MKKFHALFLLGCFILLFSCQPAIEKPGDFKLMVNPDNPKMAFVIKRYC